MRNFRLFLSFVMTLVFGFLSSSVFAASSCTDTTASSPCVMAESLVSGGLASINQAVLVIAGALVGLSILIFGARMVIRWARGRM